MFNLRTIKMTGNGETKDTEKMDYNESIQKVSRWQRYEKNQFISLQLYLYKTFNYNVK